MQLSNIYVLLYRKATEIPKQNQITRCKPIPTQLLHEDLINNGLYSRFGASIQILLIGPASCYLY